MLALISAVRVSFRTRMDTSLESRPRGCRSKVTGEIKDLICRMSTENAGWGAPKIHGELLTLGFLISERTVTRYLKRVRHRSDPARRWPAFLENHRDVIVAVAPCTLRHRSSDFRVGCATVAGSLP